MQLTAIGKNNIPWFESFFPPSVAAAIHSGKSCFAYGALVDDCACGGIALEPSTAGRCGIASLWVAPDYRRQGVATALLDKAVSLCRGCGFDELRVTIEQFGEGIGLGSFVVQWGFVPQYDMSPSFVFTLADFIDMKALLPGSGGSSICALANVPQVALSTFNRAHSGRGLFFFDSINISAVDADISMAYIDHGGIQALIWFSVDGSEIFFDGIFTESNSSRMILPLLRRAFAAAREKYAPECTVHITAVNPIVEKLLEKVLERHPFARSTAETYTLALA